MVKGKKLKNEINSVANIRKEYMVNKKKWTSFTYIGKEVMPITRVLRKFNINISFKTNNSFENCLKR